VAGAQRPSNISGRVGCSRLRDCRKMSSSRRAMEQTPMPPRTSVSLAGGSAALIAARLMAGFEYQVAEV
jgi:hypothetical protein